uniref:Uncharacterized protein n=1 Tax=Siphoviridae sp. ct3gT1 TaxID=2825323 RepID=A0A8S5UJ98_9CAUD|nr:MAG TPA: hypothetical protein [Siphoviridae sp. ct3gT1]
MYVCLKVLYNFIIYIKKLQHSAFYSILCNN